MDVARIETVGVLEALRIAAEGLAGPPTIDRLMRRAGLSIGPFEWVDQVGADAAYARIHGLYERTFHDPRFRPPPMVRALLVRDPAARVSDEDGIDESSLSARGSAAPTPAPPPEAVAIVGDGELAEVLRGAASAANLQQVAEGAAKLVVIAGLGPLEVRRLGLRKALDRTAPTTPILAHAAPYTVTEMSSTLRRGERVAGFALAESPGAPALVEVTGGLNSEPLVVQAALALFRAVGYEAVRVGDGPGLVLGRIRSMLANEAAALLEDGAPSPQAVDDAIRRELGHATGPLAWADGVGLDVVLQTMRALQQDYGDDRYRPAIRLRRLVQAGRLGRKSGRGFY